MIHRLAEDIAFYFIKRHYISIEDREVYEYGAEVLISNLSVLSLLFILSYVSNNMLYFLCFVLVFVPIRAYVGGYHASTQRNCIILTLLIYVASIAINWKFLQEESVLIAWIILILADLIILFSQPIVSENHCLSQEDEVLNIRKARQLLFFDHIIFFILIYGKHMEFAQYIAIVLGVVALLIIVEKLKKGGKE